MFAGMHGRASAGAMPPTGRRDEADRIRAAAGKGSAAILLPCIRHELSAFMCDLPDTSNRTGP
jgi:hypothetical protein